MNEVSTIQPVRMPRLVRKIEMAELAEIGVRTIEKLMRQSLPQVRLSYRCVRFDPAAVMAWLERRYGLSRRGPAGRFGRDSVAPLLPGSNPAPAKARRKRRRTVVVQSS